MTASESQPARVLILVDAGFDEHSFSRAQRTLYAAGAQIHTGALQPGLVQSRNGEHLGHRYLVDKVLDTADPALYDAVIIPGGEGSTAALSDASAVHQFLSTVCNANKPVLAFGSGAEVLAASGLSPMRQADGAVLAGRADLPATLGQLMGTAAAA